MNITLWQIYFVFLKIGAILLGGGYVILPILISELTEKRHWAEKEELINYFSLSQCLPGIIAINTSIFTGYKLKGKSGAITATAGLCTSPVITILLLASILSALTEMTLIKNIFWGVGVGIIILIVLTITEVWEKCIVDKFSFFLFLTIFLLTVFCNLSPVISILSAAACGIIFKLIKRRTSS